MPRNTIGIPTWLDNRIGATYQMPASDLRDWTVIRTWVNSLAAKLEPT